MEENYNELKELMLLGEIDGDELIRRYREYSEIDDEKALEVLKERIKADAAKATLTEKTVKVSFWQRYRYAAAAAALVLLAGGILLYNRSQTGIPKISRDVQLAMEQSRQNGKQEAEIKAITATEAVQAAGSSKHISSDRYAQAKQVTTEETKEYWLTLDDGTVIHLNNDTYLIYPEKKDAKTREVILDGEAYFMVAKDAERQFVVHTKQGDVKVYGTEFNVSTREAEGATEVVLVEGSVSVTPAGGEEQRITPGQKATMGETLVVESVDVEQYVAWNTGKFNFTDWPLKRIMEILARWYGYEVVFSDPALGDKQLSGNFDRYEAIDNTLFALETVTGQHFYRDGNTITIK